VPDGDVYRKGAGVQVRIDPLDQLLVHAPPEVQVVSERLSGALPDPAQPIESPRLPLQLLLPPIQQTGAPLGGRDLLVKFLKLLFQEGRQLWHLLQVHLPETLFQFLPPDASGQRLAAERVLLVGAAPRGPSRKEQLQRELRTEQLLFQQCPVRERQGRLEEDAVPHVGLGLELDRGSRGQPQTGPAGRLRKSPGVTGGASGSGVLR
jgi:hypothetical protein